MNPEQPNTQPPTEPQMQQPVQVASQAPVAQEASIAPKKKPKTSTIVLLFALPFILMIIGLPLSASGGVQSDAELFADPSPLQSIGNILVFASLPVGFVTWIIGTVKIIKRQSR